MLDCLGLVLGEFKQVSCGICLQDVKRSKCLSDFPALQEVNSVKKRHITRGN